MPDRSAATETEADFAFVVVDGRPLFRVRGVSAFPAKKRANDIAERIRAVAEDPAIPVDALHITDAADRTNILAGNHRILSLFEPDAALEDVDGRRLLAEADLASIATAIEQFRQERSSGYLRTQAIIAAFSLAVLAALLVGIHWALRWLAGAFEQRFATRLKALEQRAFRLLTAEQFMSTVQGSLHALRMLLLFVIAFVGLDYVLSLFPWTRPIATTAAALVIDPLRSMGNALLDALPGLAFIAILVVVTRYGLRLLYLFFSGIAGGRIRFTGFSAEWAMPTYRLVRFAAIAFAVVVAYPYIPGSSSDAFKGVSLFLGLLMSLGASSFVANSLAGYSLIYRRAFKVGDRIRVGDIVGDVVEMRQQVTHLRTPKNEEVTIPSSTMLNSHVVNYSSLARGPGLILHTEVGIGYETPWRQVEAMLLIAATRTPGLKSQPTPFVLASSLGDFCIVYELNGYCENAQAMPSTYSALHLNILDVFNERDVQIMTPHYVADTSVPKVVSRDQWFTPPAKEP